MLLEGPKQRVADLCGVMQCTRLATQNTMAWAVRAPAGSLRVSRVFIEGGKVIPGAVAMP